MRSCLAGAREIHEGDSRVPAVAVVAATLVAAKLRKKGASERMGTTGRGRKGGRSSEWKLRGRG